MPLSEEVALRILKEELVREASRHGVRVGIGDDAAVVRGAKEDQVCTVDSCEEGVHFLWEWMRPEDVARKSFHAALSDVAAMGARPSWVLSHVSLGPQVTSSWLRRFACEQAKCAISTGAHIVGGNISFASSTRVVTTAVGDVKSGESLLRSGARAGDEVWLVGQVGLARAGLLLLQQRATRTRGQGARAECFRAFRQPRALVEWGPKLVGRAHSCLDVSDGLCRDAAQLATFSGVRLVLDASMLGRHLAPALSKIGPVLGVSPLDLALIGGEDYALLATGPSRRRPRFCAVIGRVEGTSRGKKSGAFLSRNGSLRPLVGGFLHGKKDAATDKG